MPDERPRLFGRLVESTSRMTLTEQVYCILCEEIHAGRWHIGERLPGASTLSERSGLSRAPIQQAFERLEREGWVTKRPRSGTYLAAILPYGHRALGTIGIAMPQNGNRNQDPTMALHLHAILKMASEHNYVTEVLYLKEDDNWQGLTRSDGNRFSKQVKGVISLHPCHYVEGSMLAADHVPLVFWGRPWDTDNFYARPMVSHDTRYGFYLLTRRIIDEGHKRIILCGSLEQWDMLLTSRLEGHRLAMEEAGLEVQEDAFEHSCRLSENNSWSWGEFMAHYADKATAFVCASRVAQQLVAWADHHNVVIPRDLSLAANLPEALRPTAPDRTLTGIDYQLEYTVELCLRILEEQMNYRRSRESLIWVKPYVVEGASLAAPPDTARKES